MPNAIEAASYHSPLLGHDISRMSLSSLSFEQYRRLFSLAAISTAHDFAQHAELSYFRSRAFLTNYAFLSARRNAFGLRAFATGAHYISMKARCEIISFSITGQSFERTTLHGRK